MLQMAGILFLIAFSLTSLGFCIAWRMDSAQGFHAVVNLFLIPMWLLSGALFPASARHVVFRQQPGTTYQLLYGNSRSPAPEYDLARLIPREDLEKATFGELGPEAVNTNYLRRNNGIIRLLLSGWQPVVNYPLNPMKSRWPNCARDSGGTASATTKSPTAHPHRQSRITGRRYGLSSNSTDERA